MKKLLILLLVVALCGCAAPAQPTTTTPTTVPETTVPETTVPEIAIPETTAPLHCGLYLEGCPPELLMQYWDEVVHQMEYTDGTGNCTVVQKWLEPLVCRIYGEPTEEDLRVLEDFFSQLNALPNFPGIRWANKREHENVALNFLDKADFDAEFFDVVGGEDAWGAAQFWFWTENNKIHDGRVGYRTDIPQEDRSSILLEELINVMGISDTELREDSIVYQHSNLNLELSEVDWLILKLLFHPDIQPGMTAEECHEILAELYY